MFLVLRTLAYAVLFVGLLLIYLPARLLAASGIHRPAAHIASEVGGIAIATAGALLALWCVSSFVRLGKGTPAPFDAPRQLVVRGPYQYVRNPMYMGAGLALAGAALLYESAELLGYALLFLLVFHLFVLFYEEPKLRSTFGPAYGNYCRRVRRWWPVPRTLAR